MEKQLIITMTAAGELSVEKRGLTDVLQIVGLLEMVKVGEITQSMKPNPTTPPNATLLHKL
jgi:hypothetical protein